MAMEEWNVHFVGNNGALWRVDQGKHRRDRFHRRAWGVEAVDEAGRPRRSEELRCELPYRLARRPVG